MIMKITTLIARVLFSLIFLMSGFSLFSAGVIDYAASQGVPLANVFVPISGIMAIVGALSIILGYKIKIGAILIALFLIPVSFSMHAFWKVADPIMRQNQMIDFMKNMSMLGGALFFFVQGAGAYSLDARKIKRPSMLK
jgi:putative oxidoreductase